jgi:hypothetical protein
MRRDNVTTTGAERSLQGVCSITTTILGLNYDDSGFVPPDPHGAVGVSRLVGVVNSNIEVRRKDGTFVFRIGFQNFFSRFTEAFDIDFFFDPKVTYDEHEGRFVLVVLQRSIPLQISRIWLAVSKSETPDTSNDWYQFYVNSVVSIGGSNTWADYPGLAVDEEAVYLSMLMFRFSDSQYAGIRYWFFSKGLLDGFYFGQTFNLFLFNPFASDESLGSTSMPAKVHGSSGVDGSVGTFLASVLFNNNGGVDILVGAILNPTSASFTYLPPQPKNLGVITQFNLPGAPQPGTTAALETNYIRVLDAVWRDNKLWVVFNINPPNGINSGQATVHWVRLRTSGGVVTVEAQGDLGGEGIATGTFTYYPSVAVNKGGVVAYGYAASSPTTYAGAYASIGTSEVAYTVKSGQAPYDRKRGTPVPKNRWGDYTAISVDPTDDSFWVFNQYAETVGVASSEGNGRWGTAWGRLACGVRLTRCMFCGVSVVLMLLSLCVPACSGSSSASCSATKSGSDSKAMWSFPKEFILPIHRLRSAWKIVGTLPQLKSHALDMESRLHLHRYEQLYYIYSDQLHLHRKEQLYIIRSTKELFGNLSLSKHGSECFQRFIYQISK